MSKKPILCCIEGGGVRQIENVAGAMTALYDYGIKPDYFWGSSAGAIIAGLMASRMSPSTLVGLINKTPIEDLFVPQPLYRQLLSFIPGYTAAFFDATGTYNLMKQYMTADAREYARVAVTKMRSATNDNPVPQMCEATPATVMASMAIPCVFPPVVINGEKYEDGGVLNILPLPTWDEADEYEHIYIILCNADKEDSDKSVPGVIKRGITALLDTMNRERVSFYEAGWKDRDNVTVFETSPYPSSLLDWSENHGLISHSYMCTVNKLKELGYA